MAGFEPRSTTGATADSELGFRTGVVGEAGAGGTDAVAVCRVTMEWLTVEATAVLGAILGAEARATRATFVFATFVAGDEVSAGVTVALESGVTGAGSAAGGGLDWVEGAGSVDVGGAC